MKKLILFLLILLATTSCATAKNECITFKSNKAQNVNVQVYNTLGVQVKTFEIKAAEGVNSYNIENLIEGNGVYFVVVRYSADDEVPYWTKTVKLDISKVDGLH